MHTHKSFPPSVGKEFVKKMADAASTGTRSTVRAASSWIIENEKYIDALGEAIKIQFLNAYSAARMERILYVVSDTLFLCAMNRKRAALTRKRKREEDANVVIDALKPVIGYLVSKASETPAIRTGVQKVLTMMENKKVYNAHTLAAFRAEVEGVLPPPQPQAVLPEPQAPPAQPGAVLPEPGAVLPQPRMILPQPLAVQPQPYPYPTPQFIYPYPPPFIYPYIYPYPASYPPYAPSYPTPSYYNNPPEMMHPQPPAGQENQEQT